MLYGWNRSFLAIMMTVGLLGQRCTSSRETSSPSLYDSSLTIVGKLESSSGVPAANAAIYVAQESEAEARTQADGSFRFTLSRGRLQTLAELYSQPSQPLTLYFESAETPEEMSLYPNLHPALSGQLDLRTLRLRPMIPLRGVVRAAKTPETTETAVGGVVIQVGRKTVVSESTGSFTVFAPVETDVPFTVAKSGYVRSSGLWPSQAGSSEVGIALYETLDVQGQAAFLTSQRTNTGDPSELSMFVHANPLAHWIRVAQDAQSLTANTPLVNAPWRLVSEALRFPRGSQNTLLYYQFADRSQRLFSPIYAFAPESPANP